MRQSFGSVLFALNAILLVLLLVALQYVEPGTAEYAISQVSLGIILLTFVGLVLAARRGLTIFER
ncbi:hypothetical protein AUR64_03610 [Haloprofundus marisrubri]|uniref:Uncharacterized protein n=1 Tax=Haloprofundus marisrubri TaxID=1514971 RepID=A0A0W1RDK8_9EURY|nr:hypothetical protein [Haloprofundus marisrubri]KTG11355.1 hypothetical protein AUR64_03610 [Haloprofundus marisrubri]